MPERLCLTVGGMNSRQQKKSQGKQSVEAKVSKLAGTDWSLTALHSRPLKYPKNQFRFHIAAGQTGCPDFASLKCGAKHRPDFLNSGGKTKAVNATTKKSRSARHVGCFSSLNHKWQTCWLGGAESEGRNTDALRESVHHRGRCRQYFELLFYSPGFESSAVTTVDTVQSPPVWKDLPFRRLKLAGLIESLTSTRSRHDNLPLRVFHSAAALCDFSCGRMLDLRLRRLW